MILNYKNTNKEKNVNDNYGIQKIEKPYYRFLRKLNINSLQHLHCFSFPEFQKMILQNEIINLPKIEEIEVSGWLSEVKESLPDLIGFESGLYYDILAANSYARQLKEELKTINSKTGSKYSQLMDISYQTIIKPKILNTYKKGLNHAIAKL